MMSFNGILSHPETLLRSQERPDKADLLKSGMKVHGGHFCHLGRPILGNGPFSDPGFMGVKISEFPPLISSIYAFPVIVTATTMISKETKHKGLFKHSYTIDYTLKITKHHTHRRQVLSAGCLFCIYVGREQKSRVRH
jgi:hypothetical protein